MGLKCPVPTSMVHLPVQDPPDSSTPLKRAHHPFPGSINALLPLISPPRKKLPPHVKPPTKPSTPPWLPSKHPGDTLYGPGIRAYKRHPRHMARGSGAQRGQGGPKGHTANLQSNAWGAHMLPPWHFHQEKLSSRRR